MPRRCDASPGFDLYGGFVRRARVTVRSRRFYLRDRFDIGSINLSIMDLSTCHFRS
ncbi:hypothetical protein PSAB6_170018 [Paraburkholderia sabiae]|nr:hypothetical protein PSAB6_170018 [Paraburkholderia sabiae]